MQEGDYTYQLTVTDTAGQQATAQVTVIVQPGKLLPRILPALVPQGLVLWASSREAGGRHYPTKPENHSFPPSPYCSFIAPVSALPLLVTE